MSALLKRIKTGALVVSLVLTISFEVVAQDTINQKWSLFLAAGIAEHDKRLGDFPRRDVLLASQSELFGTFSFTAGINRTFALGRTLRLNAGLLHIYRLSTFTRPFEDATLPDDVPRTLDARWTEQYRELLFAPTLSFDYSLFQKLQLGVAAQSTFRYHLHSRPFPGGDKYVIYGGPWRVRLNALEFYTTIAYQLTPRTQISARYRVAQLLHNDPNLINNITYPAYSSIPRPPDFEWFNLLKFELAVSYGL